MQLIPIFVNQETSEGVYAMLFDDQTENEYDRLFNFWDDPELVLEYVKENIEYLKRPYFEGASVEDIAEKVDKESEELEILIEEYFHDEDKTLQMLFIPIGQQAIIPEHQQTKAFVSDRKYFPKPVLRMYAIRINENTFVITGGAIKLVKKMKEHLDTKLELDKLEMAKVFLASKGFDTIEALKIII
jgi:hypothetical protein